MWKVVFCEEFVEQTFSPQETHMTSLIKSASEFIDEHGLGLISEGQVTHRCRTIDGQIPDLRFIEAERKLFLDFPQTVIEHAVDLRSASQRVSILDQTIRGFDSLNNGK